MEDVLDRRKRSRHGAELLTHAQGSIKMDNCAQSLHQIAIAAQIKCHGKHRISLFPRNPDATSRVPDPKKTRCPPAFCFVRIDGKRLGIQSARMAYVIRAAAD